MCRLSGAVFRPYGDYEGLIRDWLASGHASAIIALRRGRPVGFAMVARIGNSPQAPCGTELLAIGVEPPFQGSGIGRHLLKEIERDASNQGARAMWLHTAVGNRHARNLFDKTGYRPVGLKKGFYPEGQDAILMVKKLDNCPPCVDKS